MTTVKSTFDRRYKNTFRHTVKLELSGCFPLLVIYSIGLILLVFIPAAMPLIRTIRISMSEAAMNSYYVPDYYTSVYSFGLSAPAVFLLPVAAFLMSLIQFHYMSARKSLDVYASLPIKRTSLLRAKITAAFLILGVPYFLIQSLLFLFNGIVSGFCTVLFYEYVFLLAVGLMLLALSYLLVTVISCLTGTLTEIILYSLVLTFAPFIIMYYFWFYAENVVFGFALRLNGPYEQPLFLLPYAYFYNCIPYYQYGQGLADFIMEMEWDGVAVSFLSLIRESLLVLLSWICVTAVLGIVTVRSFLNRKAELAGVKGASKFFSSVNCMITMLMGGLAVLALKDLAYYSEDIRAIHYVFWFLGMLLAYFIYQLIVLQNFHNTLKAWRQAIAPILITVFICVFGITDGFGIYLSKINPGQVAAVHSSYMGISSLGMYYDMFYYGNMSTHTVGSERIGVRLKSEEAIRLMVEFQNLEVAGRNSSNRWERESFTFQYQNGSKMKRSYTPTMLESARVLAQLEETEEFKRQTHYAFLQDLTNFRMVTAMDRYRSNTNQLDEGFRAQEFQEALQKDVLLETLEDILNPEGPTLGYLYFSANINTGRRDTPLYYTETVAIPVKSHYKNTIAYLEDSGLLSLLEPDYDNILEIAVYEPWLINKYDTDEEEWGLGLSFQNIWYDPILDLITSSAGSSRQQPSEYDQFLLSWQDEYAINTFNDPEKIREVLEDAWDEHANIDEVHAVLIKTTTDASMLALIKK